MMKTKRYNVTRYILIWMLCVSLGMIISGCSVTTLRLHSAILYEDIKESKALIENSNNIEARDSYGQTPLILASAIGQANITKILLEKGADVNVKDNEGKTPLILAVNVGGSRIVKMLLEKGADVNVKDAEGQIPLLRAIELGYSEIVRLLLDNDADISIKDSEGRTPLALAIHSGESAVVSMFIDKGVDLNTKDNEGQTPLVLAINADKPKIVSLLLDKGADINAKDGKDQTPLLLAIDTGKFDLVSLLIDKGADINTKDDEERTPLILATIAGESETVELLIEKGAELNAKDYKERSALMYAFKQGRMELAKIMMDNGADINAKDDGGRTYLHYAALENDREVVNNLIRAGAEVEPVELTGEDSYATALNYLAYAEYYERVNDRKLIINNYEGATTYFKKAALQFQRLSGEISGAMVRTGAKYLLSLGSVSPASNSQFEVIKNLYDRKYEKSLEASIESYHTLLCYKTVVVKKELKKCKKGKPEPKQPWMKWLTKNEFKPFTQTSYKLASTKVNEPTIMNIDRGRNDTKEIALTFDGASGKRFAKETLKILRGKQVVTTFFLTGRFMQRYPELVLEILEDGHEIGNHTFTHSHLTTYEKTFTHKTFPGVNKTFLQKELMDTSKVYKELTGRDLAPVWRAPYGEINSEIVQWGLDIGYTHVFWTIDGKENLDTLDWVSDKESDLYLTSEEIKNKILSFGKDKKGLNGGIILMHITNTREDDQPYLVLGDIIDSLKEKHYRFVTATSLIQNVVRTAPVVTRAALKYSLLHRSFN